MTFSFHPDAEIEFNHAIDYYEECQANLGLDTDFLLVLSITKENKRL